MKKNFNLLLIFHFLIVSLPNFAMNQSFIMKSHIEINTIAFLDNERIIMGTNQGCYCVENGPLPRSTTAIFTNNPTCNIITDQRKKRIGICSPDEFAVYDIQTNTKIWSTNLYRSTCTAAFSPINDTIFVCQNEKLASNNYPTITLPYVGNDENFNISCHPQENKFLYPSSTKQLSLKEMGGRHLANYYPNIDDIDTIHSAFYSPDGNRIAVLTNKNHLYIYNQKIKKTTKLDGDYMRAIFLPTDFIIAALSNKGSVVYWNYKEKRTIARSAPLIESNAQSIPLITIFDFSPNNLFVALTMNNTCCIHNTPLAVIKNTLYSRYCLLQQYSNKNDYLLPQEIMRLIIKKLIEPHL